VSWTQEPVFGPEPRFGAAMATIGPSVVLFGGDGEEGGGPTHLLADTWIWNGASWTRRKVTGPSARASTAMATLNGTLTLFGGVPPSGTEDSDTWTWNGALWNARHVVGPRARHDMAMATFDGVVVLFGGNYGVYGSLGDTWTWDGAAWTKVASAGPTARYSAALATMGGR
jgi:hypothetical protein